MTLRTKAKYLRKICSSVTLLSQISHGLASDTNRASATKRLLVMIMSMIDYNYSDTSAYEDNSFRNHIR